MINDSKVLKLVYLNTNIIRLSLLLIVYSIRSDQRNKQYLTSILKYLSYKHIKLGSFLISTSTTATISPYLYSNGGEDRISISDQRYICYMIKIFIPIKPFQNYNHKLTILLSKTQTTH